jgi:hypothetical protein
MEQIWGSMKHTINLETVTDQAGLHGKISEIWDSIPLSRINNDCRSLKPRTWTMEDPKGELDHGSK